MVKRLKTIKTSCAFYGRRVWRDCTFILYEATHTNIGEWKYYVFHTIWYFYMSVKQQFLKNSLHIIWVCIKKYPMDISMNAVSILQNMALIVEVNVSINKSIPQTTKLLGSIWFPEKSWLCACSAHRALGLFLGWINMPTYISLVFFSEAFPSHFCLKKHNSFFPYASDQCYTTIDVIIIIKVAANNKV